MCFLRKTFYFFLALFSLNCLYSENILLKDGRIFKGNLININKNKIVINVNNQIFEFSINSIEYLIASVNQNEYSIIKIKRKDGSFQEVNLIKLTEQALYYKNISENDLKLIKLSSITELILISKIDSISSKVNKLIIKQDNNIDIEIDINNLIAQIIKLKTIYSSDKDQKEEKTQDTISINIENPDFYERFWTKISKYLDVNSENLLWNLLENYSEKEKSINLVYNENNNPNKEKEIKNKIIELRKDFYKRAKKIILSSKM
ncbi:MAG: hypothetical protein A2086_11650 [Spirochaetes bacterium GWD1_27_9]|nr:MAG: hypothetical protein A2Z98_12075 [Spirochaetes bacterium GWB1_27_13]OHD26447.1 MAG: hypothetical protein A2Y34_10080 [Spirochaetes bacterium GWC1_27_15]OHD36387.1 MAG: hypothetical protein A2086_11650 [Spirochaetes bacterium GWD1_27_9]